MTISVDLQDAVIAELLGNSAVAAIVGTRVYDKAPEGATFPYITLGPTDAIPSDADCIASETEVIQVDIWHRDQGRKWPCKATTNAVRDALHEAELATDAAMQCRVILRRVIDDPDGITAHGVVQVEIITEES